jgi:hypothetical protein
MDVESPTDAARNEDITEESIPIRPVLDRTPRCTRCLPDWLQRILMIFVIIIISIVFVWLFPPYLIWIGVAAVPYKRRLVKEYEENSEIVQGRVTERYKQPIKFFGSTRCTLLHTTLEYNIGHSTYKREIQWTQKQFDRCIRNTTVDLLVVNGKPKSGIMMCIIENSVPYQSRWKLVAEGVLLSVTFPAYFILSLNDWHVNLFSWSILAKCCELGILSFVTFLPFLWWNPLTKHEKFIFEGAELIGGDEIETFPLQDNRDHPLTTPLLSAVTGL